mmetsp:Transcript_5620/g.6977  ORF Transcript_5620/g.6977 Transcript_5620/m.6977 type:complete len:246 (-) Transcript_5620:37-774(-)
MIHGWLFAFLFRLLSSPFCCPRQTLVHGVLFSKIRNDQLRTQIYRKIGIHGIQVDNHVNEQQINEHSAILRTVFLDCEVEEILKRLQAPTSPTLPHALPSLDEVRRRVEQAQYLLNGASYAEQSLLRASFVQQPWYFTQRFGSVYHRQKGGQIAIVDKPFDTQIAMKPSQSRRFPEETTVVDWFTAEHARATSSPPHTATSPIPLPFEPRPCHQLDFGTSGLLVLGLTDWGLRVGSLAFQTDSGS